ncbi:hypothetical protein ADUPG1_011776 [Aduncisulcus paluster]|uniref:Ribosomal RNA-processing protein 42 n=1 Tax=Aduncisulcus paluster TaxID=2918883 RepID=A0ABQ5JX85_9EUKA|nr:hypothetical protein ADUPG1_011776 [Aduncisulcus paluster]
MEEFISDAEKSYIKHLASFGYREDGRAPNTIRPISLNIGCIPQANGSCAITIDKLSLTVGIKLEVVTIDEDDVFDDRIGFSVEYVGFKSSLQQSSHKSKPDKLLFPKYERELKRSFTPSDLAILESKEHAWKVDIDVVVHEKVDDNLILFISLGVKAALLSCRIPTLKINPNGTLSPAFPRSAPYHSRFHSFSNSWNCPIVGVVCDINDHIFVDPSSTEIEAAHCICNVIGTFERKSKDLPIPIISSVELSSKNGIFTGSKEKELIEICAIAGKLALSTIEEFLVSFIQSLDTVSVQDAQQKLEK